MSKVELRVLESSAHRRWCRDPRQSPVFALIALVSTVNERTGREVRVSGKVAEQGRGA